MPARPSASRRSRPPLSDPASSPGREPAAKVELSLRLSRDGERPLTKAQRRFDALLKKVETLRAERARMATRWEKFLKVYRERVHPEERRMADRRRQVVRLLAAYWRKPKGLGSRQREYLEDLLRAQLRQLEELGPDALDAETRKLWEELNPPPAESEGAGEEDGAGDGAGADAEPEAKAADAADAASSRREPEGAAARKARESAERREAARKRGVGVIYKQLAKALHPDLEQDPAMRERKHTLMQELTKAHREGDLHTLLRLELEWLKREDGDLAKLGDEQLGIYCELLEEQIEGLQAEVREVGLRPGFAAMWRFANPMNGGPADVESILLSIRQTSEALKRLRDALGGPEGREALRAILQEVGAERRARADSFGFAEGF